MLDADDGTTRPSQWLIQEHRQILAESARRRYALNQELARRRREEAAALGRQRHKQARELEHERIAAKLEAQAQGKPTAKAPKQEIKWNKWRKTEPKTKAERHRWWKSHDKPRPKQPRRPRFIPHVHDFGPVLTREQSLIVMAKAVGTYQYPETVVLPPKQHSVFYGDELQQIRRGTYQPVSERSRDAHLWYNVDKGCD